jgi:hypothetical protein
MKRLPYYLAALASAGALAVVYWPWAQENPEPDPPHGMVLTDGPVPESMTLRIVSKQHIARDVVASRMSLIEAAALFRVLNEPVDLDALGREGAQFWALREPAHTEDERICRQVVQWVSALDLTESPDRVATAVARLTAEYRKEVRRHGQVCLPDRAGRPTIEELLDQARATMTESERNMFFGERGATGKR